MKDKEKINKLKKSTKKEFETYKEDVKELKLDVFDTKPFIQKLIFFVVGIESFIIGLALYFILKDDKKWQTGYILAGSVIGLIATLAEMLENLLTIIAK
ncbi:MAG: hypothetical protein IJ399_02025 [Bacilli bacterium]|nr:hypothetical protein [Bacilli bacterium]